MVDVNNVSISDYEILDDNKYKWNYKKKDNLVISYSYKRLYLKNYILNNSFLNISFEMFNCANYLDFKFFEDGSKKLNNVYFCKKRLCPMCSWRRSKKIFSQVTKIINEIDSFYDYEYLFLTLTCKNVSGNFLNEQIDILIKSFSNMIKNNFKLKRIVKGFFRVLEVTYNKNDDTYHPHIHCIIVVEKKYFHWRNRFYLKTNDWANLWQHYLGVDYIPIVDVRKVKTKNLKYKPVAEISKYTVKFKDVIITDGNNKVDEYLTDKNVEFLHYALKGRRLISQGGIFKKLHKELNLEDMSNDNVNLICTDVDDNNVLLNYIILKYKWNVGITNYKLVEIINP